MRLGKKEIYKILKKIGIITTQKCKDFESTILRSSHWLDNDDLKIWANGTRYIVVHFYTYNEEGDKIETKETTFTNIKGEWKKYYERVYKKS